MASNSPINPAPRVITDIFNPELWNDTDKTITTISPVPDDPVSLGGIGFPTDNTMTGQNTYNASTEYGGDVPYFNDNWSICGATFLEAQTQLIANLFSIYIWRITAAENKIITIPNASSSLNGASLTFRRFSNPNYQLLSASSNINNIDSLTNTNVILGTDVIMSIITCAYNGSSYQWFMTYTKS